MKQPLSKWKPRIREGVRAALAKLPSPMDAWLSHAARWVGGTEYRQNARLAKMTLRELGSPDQVLTGPFQGMRFTVHGLAQGGIIPKVVGCYEMELWPAVDQIIGWGPTRVVDIGAAEGYYAVGFAKRLPAARIVGFEMDVVLQKALRRIAEANGVLDHVDVNGFCDVRALERAMRGEERCAVIVDVEGYEDLLMDPTAVPQLADAIILCEIHDALVPGVGERIRARFADSHTLTVIPTRARTAADLPPNRQLSHNAAVVLSEGRKGPMEWDLFVPARLTGTTSTR